MAIYNQVTWLLDVCMTRLRYLQMQSLMSRFHQAEVRTWLTAQMCGVAEANMPTLAKHGCLNGSYPPPMTLQGSFTSRGFEYWGLRVTTSSRRLPMGDEVKEDLFAGWVFER